MCPLPGWSSSGAGRQAPRPDTVGYAMNIRAADATVSSAPKAMKTFPISDVLSSVELSLTSEDGLEVEASTTPCVVVAAVGCSGGVKERSNVVVWSEVTAPGSAGASASAGLSAAACRTELAFSDIAADMPLALSGAASAAGICALALATRSGSAGEAPLASATCFSSAFLFSFAFDAVCVDLRWAWRFFWGRASCPADLPDSAPSGFATAALSASAPAAIAGNGPARLAQSPAAKIKTDPALALIVM